MKQILICFGVLFLNICQAQNEFIAIINDPGGEPLIGAKVKVENTNIGGVTDLNGKVHLTDIPDGMQAIQISFVGFETLELEYDFPITETMPFVLELESNEELETVIVQGTRSGRNIEEIPTRVEVIDDEELGEKAIMNSTNIAMILRESTGVQIQQTSANSANQSIRIQGLDGRYTQLLKDGFPLYSGFSGGLSIMQIPPLDLKQVELVKGSSSTLYGGGAIAGFVNLVSKQPEEEQELDFMINQTSALGTTGNIFWSNRGEKAGFTMYTSGSYQLPYDPNKDGFSDIPKFHSFSFNPKFFWYPKDSTTLWFGVNLAYDNRLGGDLEVLKGSPDSLNTFSENNISKRASSQLHFEHTFSKGGILTVKNSVSFFDRGIIVPTFSFQGQQLATFSEASWSRSFEKTDIIIGGNIFTDQFKESDKGYNTPLRSYEYTTFGSFAQNNWDIGKAFTLESGMRVDYNTDYGAFVLPRVSLLSKIGKKFSSRIGGGMGYKLPTIFNEEAEVLSFQNINPLDIQTVEAEKSIGANFDVNYKTVFGKKFTFSINQMFFYTQLSNSLVLEQDSTGVQYNFTNADGLVSSRGFETNAKFTYGDFRLFLQYAYADVRLEYNNINEQKPLTPKHSVGAIFMFEQEDKWRIGYEVYYTGKQIRSDYTSTRDYFTMGLMVMRQFGRLSLFVNFENFTDTRQSRYQSMISPPNNDPTFTEVWAPTDGIVINGGLVFKLFKEEEDESSDKD